MRWLAVLAVHTLPGVAIALIVLTILNCGYDQDSFIPWSQVIVQYHKVPPLPVERIPFIIGDDPPIDGGAGEILTVEDIPKVAFLYVYDEKKDVWNRARRETLLQAKCEHIRGFITMASGR